MFPANNIGNGFPKFPQGAQLPRGQTGLSGCFCSHTESVTTDGGCNSCEVVTHYKRLKVDKDASSSEIKVAYRKAIRTSHPDKGGCEDEFREIKKSYEILSNPSKRKLYDKYGIETEDERAWNKSTLSFNRAAQLFSEMFRGSVFVDHVGQSCSSANDCGTSQAKATNAGCCSSMREVSGGMDGSKSPVVPRKGYEERPGPTPKETIVNFKVCLEDLYNGSVRKIQVRRVRCCPECNCSASMNGTCAPSEFNSCKACGGKKIVRDYRVLEADIAKGTRDNTKLIYKNQGNQLVNGIAGDVVCIVNEMAHERFTRKDDDLFTNLDISFRDAMCGFEMTITHMDGRELRIVSKNGNIVRPGDTQCLLGEGMPNVSNPNRTGSMTIAFNVAFPSNVSPDQILSFDYVLPTENGNERSDRLVEDSSGSDEDIESTSY
eukprot:Nk52_evm39s352 gene=Nk52_evmTU39s352